MSTSRIFRHSAASPGLARPGSGYSLLELLVVLALLGLILVGALTFLDITNRIALGQASKSDLQQSVRASLNDITRKVRTAGRGGLPLADADDELPTGLAFSIENNVVDGTTISAAAGAPEVVAGTDILTLRGVITSPIYFTDFGGQTDPVVANRAFYIDPDSGEGWIDVWSDTPTNSVWQPLDVLQDKVEVLEDGGVPPDEAIILVSPFSDSVYGVAKLDWGSLDAADVVRDDSDDDADGKTDDIRYMRIPLSIDVDALATGYAELSAGGVFPTEALNNSGIAYMGFLQEFRYYVTDAPAYPNLAAITETERRLARGQFYPNSDTPYDGDDANFELDLIDNVIDFQVAMAFDTNGDGVATEEGDGENDEWLLNGPGDDPDDAIWAGMLAEDAADFFQVLRVSVFARGEAPDRNHLAKEIVRIEDMVYASDPARAALNEDDERHYQRELLSRIIDLRNL